MWSGPGTGGLGAFLGAGARSPMAKLLLESLAQLFEATGLRPRCFEEKEEGRAGLQMRGV